MADTELSFERLIAPIDTETFLSEYWEKKHLVVRRDDPSYYDSVFTIADVDRWLSQAKNAQSDMAIFPPPDRKHEGRYLKPGQASMQDLYRAFDSGNSIAIEDIQEYWPPLAPLVNSLSHSFSARVKVNLYFTPAGGVQGVHIHPDVLDVFAVQVDGAKDWYIYEPGYMLPTQNIQYWNQLSDRYQETSVPLMNANQDEVPTTDEFRLEKGDLLFLPRGLPHRAVTPAGSPSLHLAVQIKPLYWIDFVKAAAEAVSVDHEEMRGSLPAGFLSNAAAREGMAETFQSLLNLLGAEVSFERTLNAVMEKMIATTAFPPDGHFQQLTELSKLDLDSTVERRGDLTCLVKSSNGHVSIHFASASMQLPDRAITALEFVRDNERFQVRDLPTLEDKAKIVLARRLIRDGLLRLQAES